MPTFLDVLSSSGEFALEDDDSLSVPTESLLERKVGRLAMLFIEAKNDEEGENEGEGCRKTSSELCKNTSLSSLD